MSGLACPLLAKIENDTITSHGLLSGFASLLSFLSSKFENTMIRHYSSCLFAPKAQTAPAMCAALLLFFAEIVSNNIHGSRSGSSETHRNVLHGASSWSCADRKIEIRGYPWGLALCLSSKTTCITPNVPSLLIPLAITRKLLCSRVWRGLRCCPKYGHCQGSWLLRFFSLCAENRK